ncbi:MAG: 2-C-methyl-D-erythritol 4-phosphate cytidylyltransferase [Spirochaetes bacterium]|nr:2-C-methyl-D-erythritol 4-phosphate cytidylyltransferase [Spirochaetota bacterium]
MKTKTHNHALILAGGTGSRTGVGIPKQMFLINGIPLIIYTIQVFQNCEEINSITVVSHPDYCSQITEYAKQYSIDKLISVIEGGENRQSSSRIGVESLNAGNNDIVLIHDAARPFVTEKIILSATATATEHGAAAATVPSTDTVYITENNRLVSIPKRQTLRNAQTPQAFRHSIITHAHQNALKEGISDASDDTILVLKAGYNVVLLEGSISNIKITSAEDLVLAERILANKKL